MKTLKERAISASKHYLERKDYTILDSCWTQDEKSVDLVAKDNDTIVFVSVNANKADEGFKESNIATRQEREASAIAWLAENGSDISDCVIRFDNIALVAFSTSRAILRHHINSFGSSEG